MTTETPAGAPAAVASAPAADNVALARPVLSIDNSIQLNSATQENKDADKEWIKKTAAGIGAEWVPILELCATIPAAHVRAALFEAAKEGSRVKSVLGFVRWRAARLHEAAQRQRAADTQRAQRDSEAQLRSAREARDALVAAERDRAFFEAMPDEKITEIYLRLLSELGEPLRTRLLDRGPKGGLLIRGMIVDRARKEGYNPLAPTGLPKAPVEPDATGPPPPPRPS